MTVTLLFIPRLAIDRRPLAVDRLSVKPFLTVDRLPLNPFLTADRLPANPYLTADLMPEHRRGGVTLVEVLLIDPRRVNPLLENRERETPLEGELLDDFGTLHSLA